MGFATTALGSSVAGLYPINGSGLTANNGNYLFVQAAGNAIAFTIGSQAALVITADNKTKTYGAALPRSLRAMPASSAATPPRA